VSACAQRKKDVSYVKPFLSLVTVSKCLLLVAGSFFGRDDPETTVVTTAIIMVGERMHSPRPR
jgi:hypothetical protein